MDRGTRTPTSRGTDVAIVGAGVIGLGIAWRLRQRGARVTLIDPTPGRGASWAAAGMLAPVTEAHFGEETLLELNLASQRRWPAFSHELSDAAGRPSGYRESGTILVARDRDDVAAIDRLTAFQRELGLQVERLTSRELRQLEPFLAPTVVGGSYVAGDHQVDNRALIEALIVASERTGVVFAHQRAVGIAHRGERATGVRLQDGRLIEADVTVLAAGHATASLEGLPPDWLPVRAVKGQLLHLSGPEDLVPSARSIRSLDVYVVARGDGRLVVGATMEERGEDTSVTAGAVLDLLRYAYELLPGLAELEFTEATAGLRPGTPDNAPLLGRGHLDGLVVATGHFRNGILLAPVTADSIAELVATDSVPHVIAPFDPHRFVREEMAG